MKDIIEGIGHLDADQVSKCILHQSTVVRFFNQQYLFKSDLIRTSTVSIYIYIYIISFRPAPAGQHCARKCISEWFQKCDAEEKCDTEFYGSLLGM